MSVFDLLKSNKKQATRQLINAKSIDETGVETYKKEYLVYFLIKPLNIAVLSETNIRSRVLSLMNILKEVEAAEIACINSRETFEENKLYLKQRIAEENNPHVRELLQKDEAFLDRIQIQTASAREFLIMLRFRDRDVDTSEVRISISRIEKMLKEQGFMAKLASKEDIKRIFAVYFVQNLTQVYFDDYNGERWVKADVM